MRCLFSLLFLCFAVAGCGLAKHSEVAPLPGSVVNPGGDEPYCPSGQQPPCD